MIFVLNKKYLTEDIDMLQVTIMTTAFRKQEVLSVNQFNTDSEAGEFIKAQYDADNTITWNVVEIEEHDGSYQVIYRGARW